MLPSSICASSMGRINIAPARGFSTVQRNGEFCVMVGLAVGGRAALGIVVVPVTGVALVGVSGEGAWSIDPSGARTDLVVRPVTSVAAARMIGVSSHRRAKSISPRRLPRTR